MRLEALGVLPVRSVLDAPNQGFADPILWCDVPRGARVHSDSKGLLLGQLRQRVSFRVYRWAFARAALLGHVSKIIGLRPQPEMVRIHAGAIVARVADREPLGNRAIREFVCKAVRPAPLAPNTEKAVSISRAPGSPLPAAGGEYRVRGDEIGFGIFVRSSHVRLIARNRAKFARRPTHPRVKAPPASLAAQRHSKVSFRSHRHIPLSPGSTIFNGGTQWGAKLCGWKA